MGTVAQLTGEPYTFDYQGKGYPLSGFTLEVQAKFERYLEKYTIDGYKRTSRFLADDEAREALRSIYQDIGLGKYTFGTSTVGEALRSPVHLKYIFFLCLARHDKTNTVTTELVEEMAKTHWDEMIAALNQANLDPNERAKAKTQAQATTPAS